MPTETEVIEQLAGYFAWLEDELGAPMHRANIVREERSVAGEVVPLVSSSPPRRRRGLVTLAAGLVAASLFAAYQLRQPTSTTSVVTAPVESVTTQPPQSSTAATAVPDSPMFWAPVDLPDNLVVWDVGWSRSGWQQNGPSTEQLFGRYDASNTSVEIGLLITIQDAADWTLPVGEGIRTVTVRGVRGATAPDGAPPAPDTSVDTVWIDWVEGGHLVRVKGRGMTVDEAVAMLDAMQWRGDGSSTFEPSSAALPLIAEESSGTALGGDVTSFVITDADGPTPQTGPLDAGAEPASAQAVAVHVGPVLISALRPEMLYSGQRRPDGSIVTPDNYVAMEPDGTSIRITGGGDVIGQAAAITNSIRLVGRDELAALVGAVSDRLGLLPEVAIAEFDHARVVLRGGTPQWPRALCLAVGATERCRAAPGLRERPNWRSGVLIDGRWYIVGRQPASDPVPVSYPWTPDLPSPLTASDVTIIEPTQSQLVDGQLLWYTEVPATAEAMGVGYIDAGGVVIPARGTAPIYAYRRPDSG